MAKHVGPVLVGTDFSEVALGAVVEARRLAALIGTPVLVMHVIDSGRGTGNAFGWSQAARMDAWLNEADLTPDQLLIRYGSAWVELARYATDVEPAMLVIGSHGSSGYQPLAVGSTATRLTVHSRWPVVLVSPRAAARGSDVTAPVRRVGETESTR